MLLSWPVALSNSSRLLGFVGHIDSGYFRLVRFFENWDGRIGRWLLYPVVWVGGKWAVFASRNGDRSVAAALRLFGYTIALMLVAFLAILAVYIFIALIVIALVLWVLGQIFDVDTGDAGFRRVPKIGRRGHEIFESDGGLFSTDKQVGRSKRRD